MGKLFNNPPKVVLLVLAFLLLFLAYLKWGPSADAAEFEAGPTFTSEFNGGLGIILKERFLDKYDVGVTLLSEQTWDDGSKYVGNNGNVWAAYVAKRPMDWWIIFPDEMAIGPSVWIKKQSPINGCEMGYMLNLKYRVGDNFSIGVRHWSNAGICKPNRGQDLLTIGYKF